MRFLLDTNVVVSQHQLPEDAPFAISAATVAELEYGVLGARSDNEQAERLARLLDIRHRFETISFDDEAAHHYARLAHLAFHAGRNPRSRVMDTIIAATAQSRGAGVVTSNTKDFAPFAHELLVLTPSELTHQWPALRNRQS